MRTTATAASALAFALALLSTTARAVDEAAYLGSVALVAGEYCPPGNLPADGRELDANQHQALFTLLGNRFGGDGQTTFKLPDLSGQTPKGLLYCVTVAGIWPPQDP